jgi:hypothetical protein
MTAAPKALRERLRPPVQRAWGSIKGLKGSRKWLALREFSGVRYPGEPLLFEASPAQQEPQHRLLLLMRLPQRWLRRSPNIRTPQRAINSAATAIYSRSRTPAHWSTVKSVRRAGVNSGSKRLVKPGAVSSTAKRPGTPVVSPGSHSASVLFHDGLGQNSLICIKADLLERCIQERASSLDRTD